MVFGPPETMGTRCARTGADPAGTLPASRSRKEWRLRFFATGSASTSRSGPSQRCANPCQCRSTASPPAAPSPGSAASRCPRPCTSGRLRASPCQPRGGSPAPAPSARVCRCAARARGGGRWPRRCDAWAGRDGRCPRSAASRLHAGRSPRAQAQPHDGRAAPSLHRHGRSSPRNCSTDARLPMGETHVP